MDIKTTKLTSDISIGDGKPKAGILNFVEKTLIGDNPKGDCSSKKNAAEQQILDFILPEVKRSKSLSPELGENLATQNQDSGCGDFQKAAKAGELRESVLTLTDSEEDCTGTEEEMECNAITWRWQEAISDDGTNAIKCVDVLDEISSHADMDEDNQNSSTMFRSTPLGMHENQDCSDISSDVIDDLDTSGEACCNRLHYPSMLSTSVEEDEDEDSTGFHCYEYGSHDRKRRDASNPKGHSDDEFDNVFEEVADPHLKSWIRNKMDRSRDVSEQSDSIDEEVMKIQAMKISNVAVEDKSIQVSEEDILFDGFTDACVQMDNWFKEGASLEVKAQASKQTQTLQSFLGQIFETDEERLVAGKDEKPDVSPFEIEKQTEGAVGQERSTDEETFAMPNEGEELNISSKMNDHVKNLMSALPGISPISTEDGGSVWMVPTLDENGNLINVVVDDGTVWDIFIFRPSNPTTVSSTQTYEEEFESLGRELTAQAQHPIGGIPIQ